jgi:cytochrome c
MPTHDGGRNSRIVVIGVIVWASGCWAAGARPGPQLGKPIAEADIAAWNIDIQATGGGLPPGQGTAAQGAALFAEKCVACHGAQGEGGLGPPVIGNHPIKGIDESTVVLAGYWPYASPLFDYIRRAMPWQSPRSLTDEESYALTAFILARSGLIGEADVINAQTLPRVRMPNRDGFIKRFPKLTPPIENR